MSNISNFLSAIILDGVERDPAMLALFPENILLMKAPGIQLSNVKM